MTNRFTKRHLLSRVESWECHRMALQKYHIFPPFLAKHHSALTDDEVQFESLNSFDTSALCIVSYKNGKIVCKISTRGSDAT